MVRPGSKGPTEHLATGPELPSEILPLLGESVVILHGPSAGEAHLSGSDVDCGVVGLDPQWPLRMPGQWRLCQYLQYDLNGWFWAIERQGQVINLDTIDDVRGLGRDAFRTGLLAEEVLHPSPSLRATYLTAKRLRKGIRSGEEWERIRTLAEQDPEGYKGTLREVVGPRLSPLLAEAVLAGRQPGPEIAAEVRRERFKRRFGSPGHMAAAVTLGGRRRLQRVLSPTGLYIMVVGPEGTGKSTLAQALPGLLKGTFRRWQTFHWRPGLLPRPGRLIGREESDPQRPHARSPYGPILSTALLGYYWLDSLLGGWLRIWPFRVRTGLVIAERGWWDVAVDPRRYRLMSPPRMVRALGFFLLRPDLVLLLQAPPQAILERKSEISREELERQASAWDSALLSDVPVVRLDTSRTAAQVATEAREQVLQMLERRAISRIGGGWSALPSRPSARWVIPRRPKETAKAGLRIYHPVTTKGRLVWEAARLGAAAGGFRLLPKAEPPPRSVRQILAPHIPSRGTLAAARANHEGRYIALIIDGDGRCSGVAKVATDDDGAAKLEREAASIERFRGHLHPPLVAPTILERSSGLLLLEAISWRPRWRAWRLDEEVARAMGALFRTSSSNADGPDAVGGAHGDWAPWNMLWTGGDWVLIDWEEASDTAPPFYDVCHYLVQSHSLLGRPTLPELLRGFGHGDGWVGSALRSYAEGAHLSGADAQSFLAAYLQTTEGSVRVGRKSEAAGLAARRTLLARLKG
jgi:energy-coupling factor transporter ATP-binding protein EcfA2